MKIGDTVQRQDPGGRNTIFNISNQEDLKYHEGLEQQGYEYLVLKGEITDPFSDSVIIHKSVPPEDCEACSA